MKLLYTFLLCLLVGCATKTTHPDGTVTEDSPQIRVTKALNSAVLIVASTKGALQGEQQANEKELLKTDLSEERRKELTSKNEDIQGYLEYAALANSALVSASSIATGLPCFTQGTCTDAQLADASTAIAQALVIILRAK